MDSVEVVLLVERAFDIKFLPEEPEKIVTVGEFYDLLLTKIPPSDADRKCASAMIRSPPSRRAAISSSSVPGSLVRPFLRENAQREIDRPCIIAFQRLDRLETAQPDAGIDLHMGAHAGRALNDRPFERPRAPRA
jgi:hypothetical protein